jgi:zinc protease
MRRPEDVGYVRRRIAGALAEAAEKPLDPSRLEAIKSHLRYQFARSLEKTDDVANTLGAAMAVNGSTDSINALYAAYERLTPSDLRRVAGRYFQPSNETAVILETESRK